MNITNILKEVPLSAVLKERVELEQAKAEFEILQANAGTDAAETRFQASESRCTDLAAALDNEKKEHQLTRQKLQEALDKIGRLTSQPKPPPQITIDRGLGKIPRVV
jgi:hypothetical protein